MFLPEVASPLDVLKVKEEILFCRLKGPVEPPPTPFIFLEILSQRLLTFPRLNPVALVFLSQEYPRFSPQIDKAT